MQQTDKDYEVTITEVNTYSHRVSAANAEEAISKARDEYHQNPDSVGWIYEGGEVTFDHEDSLMSIVGEDDSIDIWGTGLSRLAWIGEQLQGTDYDLRVDISTTSTFTLQHNVSLLNDNRVVLFLSYDEDPSDIGTEFSITDNVCDLILTTVFKENGMC